MNVTLFGINLVINPIAFTLPIGKNGWDVYWYGIIIATGFLLALLYAYKNASRFNLNIDRMIDVVLVVVPIAILSARAYYVLFDGEKIHSIKEFFGFGSSSGFSGIAIYGGVIGAFVSGAIMCKLRKVNILDMFDIASIGFIIGQGVGRWGNFMNQEAYGSFTNSSWWGMQSDRTISEMGEGLVHPCFLYESVWCIIGFFILNHFSKKRKFSGQIFLIYGAWYGFGRAFIELLRTDSLMLGKIRVSSLLSFVVCITALVLLYIFLKRSREIAVEGDYEEIFEKENETEFIEQEKSEDITEEINDVEEENNEAD